MRRNWKAELGSERGAQENWLRHPVIGLEAEFNVFVDGIEVVPETHWAHPRDFIDVPLLTRTNKSSQLPTGGAVYFDRGVIEVVTPVIELDAGAAARAVRNLWEQMGYVRGALDRWENHSGHHVRLRAYSTHYNVSFEIPASEQTRERNVRRLALLLAYLLPPVVAVAGTNRRSTGVGVRPRGNRIEVTADFTPDPALMIATMSAIAGIVRGVMAWPSYRLGTLDPRLHPTIAGVRPGKHTTRKGWLTKDEHYPVSPFTCDIDASIWRTRGGEMLSLRGMALRIASSFRADIERWSDPWSVRLLFAVLAGRAPSMLDLGDRPAAYDDVGRLCRWGNVIADLADFRGRNPAAASIESARRPDPPQDPQARVAATSPAGTESGATAASEARPVRIPRGHAASPSSASPVAPARLDPANAMRVPAEYLDRRRTPTARYALERRGGDRRLSPASIPFPDRRLTRSAYERVFLELTSGRSLTIAGEAYTPVAMKGWCHALLRRNSDGEERLLTIDQLADQLLAQRGHRPER